MNQWYRRTLTKIILVLVGALSGAAFITSLAIAVTFAGTANPAGVARMVREPYEESADFSAAVGNMTQDVLAQFRVRDMMETDGAYNPDKLIDVMEYTQTGRISGVNASGIAYTLGQLEDWGEDYYISDSSALYSDNEVVVCRRPDGSYYYYYLDDFLSRFERGEMRIEFTDPAQDQATFLQELQEGRLTDSGGYELRIYDREGAEMYTDCWNFGQSLRERYAPAGAKNLLEVVNGSQDMNGQLSAIYEGIAMTLTDIYDNSIQYQNGWDWMEEGNTNFTYIYINEETKQVYTNRADYEGYADAEAHIQDLKSGENVRYLIVRPKLRDFETNMNVSASGEWTALRSSRPDGNAEIVFAAAVDTSYPVQDQFYEGRENYNSNLPFLRSALIMLIAGGLIFLICTVWLSVTDGKKPGDETIHLTAFDRWKTEIAAALIILIWGVVTLLLLSVGLPEIDWSHAAQSAEHYMNEYGTAYLYSGLFTTAISLADTTGVFCYGFFSFLCFYAGYLSLIRRIRAKILWKGSLVFAVIHFVKRALNSRRDTLAAGILTVGFIGLQLLAIASRSVPAVFLSCLADLAALWFILTGAMAKGRIRKGIEEIASGNLAYRIDLNGLHGTERHMAEKVNDIGGGLNRAVDEAMRNERLKTDLITNVSHDIKTPLTSIINYVDILKRSDIADEKIRGYLDILEAKAQRLKTLTEDVVEASKVSSGNITLEYMDVDLREMIRQTEGEMAEKFSARKLTMIVSLPEEPAVVHVDGRRMWRVLENIFNNAAKYAMPGTRVYADLTASETEVRFSLKNISEQPLNIPAEELTERFIRGDISRSTEGSGLGLSIAKSLTTMQGGKFSLYLDGDLFRADLAFPRVTRGAAPGNAGPETGSPENAGAQSAGPETGSAEGSGINI